MLTSLLCTLLTRSSKPFVFTDQNDTRIDFENIKRPGLYVHIPFCRSLCAFCPYNKELYRRDKADRYVESLLREIDAVCAYEKKREASSLYFGGGTPALVTDRLGEIIGRLKSHFDITEGIGIELHPDDVTPENLAVLKAAGVTMVSVGIQSFDKGCLEKIGRRYDHFREKLMLIGECGFDAVDVDLIFAIPGQDERTLQSDIEAAFSCGATQVSTYPFIDFTFSSNEYRPLPERCKKRMLRSLVGISEKMDLQRTSVWTFAKKGTPRYSSVTRNIFLGFGAGAASLLRGSFKINTFGVDEYCRTCDGGEIPTAVTLRFSSRQRAAYHLFWSVYSLEIDPRTFEESTGRNLRSTYRAGLAAARLAGLIRKRGSAYAVTPRGAAIYHMLEQKYTRAYIDKTWSVLKKTPRPERIELR